MDRMFPEVTRTWNPVVGCLHGCSYCWARELAEGKLRHLPRYQDGFKPKLVEQELRRRFHKGLIFVSSMGDLWGVGVPPEWIERVLTVVRESPQATFLFLTKNPRRYDAFIDFMPSNVILGATIETNCDLRQPRLISTAPSPLARASWMINLRHFDSTLALMVSIEPILDFDINPSHKTKFVSWIREIQPAFVYVGFDNHGHRLPEPTLAQTHGLIKELHEFTDVRIKTLRKR
ncbi:MAG: DUF5131 family protein [Chloroflexota bacterium]